MGDIMVCIWQKSKQKCIGQRHFEQATISLISRRDAKAQGFISVNSQRPCVSARELVIQYFVDLGRKARKKDGNRDGEKDNLKDIGLVG